MAQSEPRRCARMTPERSLMVFSGRPSFRAARGASHRPPPGGRDDNTGPDRPARPPGRGRPSHQYDDQARQQAEHHERGSGGTREGTRRGTHHAVGVGEETAGGIVTGDGHLPRPR